MELINAKEEKQTFMISEDITYIGTYELISNLRYSVFNEEQAYLVLARTQAINTAKEKYLT